jgi:translation initiation factor IF-2
MAETLTTPRLMAAAKEFNIGKDTLVDFLVSKGFDKDELKPTTKLSEEMYRALQNEFQSDKVAKIKSTQIDLPKGAAAETKKKKDEEEINFRKEEKKPAKKEEVPAPVVEPVQETPVVPEPQPEPVKPEEPEVVRLDAPEIEGPKIVNKIDLSEFDSSTRPKKTPNKPKKEK